LKVLHIITSLGDGGAENTLYKICKHDSVNEHIIISLKRADKYSLLLKKIGIKVYHLNMKFYSILNFFYLIKLLRFLKPNIVQTWLVHGDLIGGVAAKLSGFHNIVWNIRYSNLEIKKTNLVNLLLIKLLAKLSFYIPKLIIVVSTSTKRNCKDLGYHEKKLFLIPNGYDLSILKPSKNKRLYFRKRFKIKKKTPIIGNVARYDPMKDHANLLMALSLIQKQDIDFFCILVGSNVDKKNMKLVNLIKRLKLSNYVKLLGSHNNIVEVMNEIDVYAQSSSYGEGFPNVVAEAMACKTPCIVTNVGDAAFIVGKTGWVVPKNNSLKLSKAIIQSIFLKMKTKNWQQRCNQARLRIAQNFDIDKMIESYNKLWSKVQSKG